MRACWPRPVSRHGRRRSGTSAALSGQPYAGSNMPTKQWLTAVSKTALLTWRTLTGFARRSRVPAKSQQQSCSVVQGQVIVKAETIPTSQQQNERSSKLLKPLVPELWSGQRRFRADKERDHTLRWKMPSAQAERAAAHADHRRPNTDLGQSQFQSLIKRGAEAVLN